MANFKIYVISLKRAEERRAKIIENFSKLNIPFTFFDAYDGKSLTDEDKKLVKLEHKIELKLKLWQNVTIEHDMTNNEIGCALSHLAVYQDIVKNNLDYAFIFEDDVSLNNNLNDFINNSNFQKHIDKWDIINFSVQRSLRSFSNYKIKLDNSSYLIRQGHNNIYLNSLCNRRRFYLLANSYIVSHQACKRLIDVGYPVRFVADFLLGHIASSGLRLYYANTNIFSKENLVQESTIGERNQLRIY